MNIVKVAAVSFLASGMAQINEDAIALDSSLDLSTQTTDSGSSTNTTTSSGEVCKYLYYLRSFTYFRLSIVCV